MKRTQLWHVGIIRQGNEYVVAASATPQPDYLTGSHMRFRALTGRAAARRFIRGNLKDVLFKIRYGDWEIHSKFIDPDSDFPCREIMHSLPQYVKIVVL